MPGPIWRDALVGALEVTPETPWDLNTLNGVNAGGHGNEITATKDKCAGLEEEELIVCETEAATEKYAAELASGVLIIDPLTGKAIPNPNNPGVAPDQLGTPVP
jgi:hypothetical protein